MLGAGTILFTEMQTPQKQVRPFSQNRCKMITIVWFKRDLRIFDHKPLYEAAQQGIPVLPLYVVEPAYWQQPDVSRRHWHFIHDSLQALRVALEKLGQPLIVRVGDVCAVLAALREKYTISALYSHEETGNAWTWRRDKEVAAWCKSHSIAWHEFPTNGVVRRLPSRDQWSAIHRQRMQAPLEASPEQLLPIAGLNLGTIPAKYDPLFGATDIGQVQSGGRTAGQQVLDTFLGKRAASYTTFLSKPGPSAQYCSRLSTHLAYGTFSVREIFQASWQQLQVLKQAISPEASKLRQGIRNFLSRLHWRCHFIQKLEDQPEIEYQCIHPAYEGMREPAHREDYLQAWYEGRTGYPLVDACMRSLHAQGWLNFRMRAMVVSFASYDLWLDWRKTGPLLAQLFTDYEPGIHYSQLQMQSGVTGINAVRIYDPTKQLRDHDPEGTFVRHFTPALQTASAMWMKCLDQQPSLFTKDAPAYYPAPIVNHQQAVAHTKARITQVRQSAQYRAISASIYQKLGSRKRSPASRSRKSPSKSHKPSHDVEEKEKKTLLLPL